LAILLGVICLVYELQDSPAILAQAFVFDENPKPSSLPIQQFDFARFRNTGRTLIILDIENGLDNLSNVLGNHQHEVDQILILGDLTKHGTKRELERVLRVLEEKSNLPPNRIIVYPGNREYRPFHWVRDTPFKFIPGFRAARDSLSYEEFVDLVSEVASIDPSWKATEYIKAPDQFGPTHASHFPLSPILSHWKKIVF